ncbi:hypothetical protein ACFOY2_46815 [Nonomuraea purpurea]|uniref:Uncharacterized protein n=1 Tax=Nonomuraea purpurea TaxID=1849276 RepID=A0ABV8GRG4_9ACTN
MNNSQRHPATGAPPERVPASLQAITEQARHTWQHHLDDIVRRLGRGERLTAEQIYDTLRAQTLCIWWRLLARHIEHTESQGMRPDQSVAKFVSWITPYLDDPTPPDPSQAVRRCGQDGELELALAHLGHSLALIRQGAARTFLAQAQTLAQAETLAPACPAEQAPSASIGQEATA